MMPVECDVRLFDELSRLLDSYDCVAPRAVVSELDGLAGTAGTEATAASVGADLARERCRIVDTDASYADDALVELAATGEFGAVVTNDQPLKRRVLDAGVPVISLRGQNKLAITRP
ncbi:twitching motility protein PilT [Halobacteriales archaeon QS_1_68_17]|nr:MAG: twitching motility protein PilT [Halobacteriales archaeon QS_1_68_17]